MAGISEQSLHRPCSRGVPQAVEFKQYRAILSNAEKGGCLSGDLMSASRNLRRTVSGLGRAILAGEERVPWGTRGLVSQLLLLRTVGVKTTHCNTTPSRTQG